jgi:hypothetical protein
MIDDAFHPLMRLDMGRLHYFSVLGRALYTAQHLEMNCRAIAGFVRMRLSVQEHGSAILDDEEFLKGIANFWKSTLGQLVNYLTEMDVFAVDACALFREALRARNEIAHDIAIDISENLDAELDERIGHIKELVRKIAAADKVASLLIHILNEDPLPISDFFNQYEKRVEAWVAEETFEEE